MNAVRFFRLAVGLLLLLGAGNATAQMRDVEYPTPRVPLSPVGPAEADRPAPDSPAPRAEQWREPGPTRPLQPYPGLLLRRGLPAPAVGVVPAVGPELRGLLSAAPWARPWQWETAQPASCRVGLVAALP